MLHCLSTRQNMRVCNSATKMLFCCSHGFINNLQLGGPTPKGARKAPLSEKYLSMMQEVALNEQVLSDFYEHLDDGLSVLVLWVSTSDRKVQEHQQHQAVS